MTTMTVELEFLMQPSIDRVDCANCGANCWLFSVAVLIIC